MKKTVLFLAAALAIFATSCQTSNTPQGDNNMQQNNSSEQIEEKGKMPVTVKPENDIFCVTWASSQYLTEPHNMPPLPLANNSIRQIVRTSTGAEKIRVKFSNRCGNSPLEIKSAHIALSAGQGTGKILSDTDTIITFSGSTSVTIPAGKEIYSDVFEFSFPALTEISISTYFGKVPSELTGHPGSRTNSFIEKGNAVSNEKFSAGFKTPHWYVIAGIEEYNAPEKKAVICLGDSITDGRGSTDDLQNRWTDNFATLLQNNDSTKNRAVINQGIGGTLVTSNGTERFDRDVLNQPGAAYCIVLYGVNDLIYANMNADTLISCYKRLISKAHKKNILIYGGTILPFQGNNDWTETKEKNRLAVNKWILENAGKEGGFDGAIDFASVMKDGDDEKLPESNENDKLHPTAKGYKTMIKAITDLSMFTKTADFKQETNSQGFTADNISSFLYKLPESLPAGGKVTVKIKGKNNGQSGFRLYLIKDGVDVNLAKDIYVDFKSDGKDYKNGDFEISATLEASSEANTLMIKGPVYGANIEDVTFLSVSLTINGKTTEIDPAGDVL